jgi:hypothetical protein
MQGVASTPYGGAPTYAGGAGQQAAPAHSMGRVPSAISAHGGPAAPARAAGERPFGNNPPPAATPAARISDLTGPQGPVVNPWGLPSMQAPAQVVRVSNPRFRYLDSDPG